jgi:membrane protein DedA with SNARE-associated domain/membrane-associated phospholipid phosphatase
MTEQIGRLVADYGYLIVALFIAGEGLAIPFPTDTTLITAAAFAAHGRLSLAIVFLVATASATMGSTAAFVIGRRGGDFFERHSRRVHPRILIRTRDFFDRHGGAAVMSGRFIPFARMLISPMAGLSSMSLVRFTLYNLSGAALWAAVFCGVGWFFGQHPPAFGHGLVRAALVVTVGLAVLATVAVAGGWLVEESDAAWRAEGTVWHRILSTAPMRWLLAHSPRARRFLVRRFSPTDYLGLNLTIGLGLSFVALVIFAAITRALLARETVPQFDLALASALRESATPAADAFWTAVSRLGRVPIMVVPGLAIGLLLVRRRGWLPLAGWLGAIIGSVVLDAIVKHFLSHEYATAGLGAPSGQALEALVGYGMIGYFATLATPSRRARTITVVALAVLVLAICFGRLYLGTRYFSDVVSGLAAGGVWLAACITGLEVARRRSDRERRGGLDRRDEKVAFGE